MRFLCIALALIFTSLGFGSFAQAEQRTEAEACAALASSAPLPQTLQELLGSYETCKRTEYEASQWGIRETLIATWPDVQLTVNTRPPETVIYVVDATGQNGLYPDWFISVRDEMISPDFGIDWSLDKAPEPTSEHFVSRNSGTNAQVWIKRNSRGEVVRIRFSYAL